MKYAIAAILLLAVAVSAQVHLGGLGHRAALGHAGIGHGGHLSSGYWGGHHSRLGRSLVSVPVVHAPVGHAGLIGAYGHHGGLVHHRFGRSILLAQPIVGTGLWNHGVVGHHGLVGHSGLWH